MCHKKFQLPQEFQFYFFLFERAKTSDKSFLLIHHMLSFIGLVSPLASPCKDNTFVIICGLIAHAGQECTKNMLFLGRHGCASDHLTSPSTGKFDWLHFKRGKQESAPKNLSDGLKGDLFGGIRWNQIGKIYIFE